MSQFNVTFENTEEFDLTFNSDSKFNVEMTTVIEVFPDAYEGQYQITPNAETQVLDTRRLVMIDNVTINPIPSNYGKITWNGSFLTIS